MKCYPTKKIREYCFSGNDYFFLSYHYYQVYWLSSKKKIGGEHGGARDAIQNEKTGLLCNGEDINEIYNSIIKFFENDKYKEYGSNALKFSESFSWNKIIRKYLNLI